MIMMKRLLRFLFRIDHLVYRLWYLTLALCLCGCVKPWGKPDPPPTPKPTVQQEVELVRLQHVMRIAEAAVVKCETYDEQGWAKLCAAEIKGMVAASKSFSDYLYAHFRGVPSEALPPEIQLGPRCPTGPTGPLGPPLTQPPDGKWDRTSYIYPEVRR